MRNHGVRHPHLERFLGAVGLAEEEDLAGSLLTALPGEQRRTVAAVEARHIGIGLLELAVLATGDRQVAHHVQAVPAADRPAIHHGDHDLGHEANQPLTLENVQTSEATEIGSAGSALVLVAVLAADALITAGAKRPAARVALGDGPLPVMRTQPTSVRA